MENLSCYFRYMKDVLRDEGIEIGEKKEDVDRKIHETVGVEHRDCSEAWRRAREILTDESRRAEFTGELEKRGES